MSGAIIAGICVLVGSQVVAQNVPELAGSFYNLPSVDNLPSVEVPAKYFELPHLGLHAQDSSGQVSTCVDSECSVCTVYDVARFIPGTAVNETTILKVGSGTMTSLKKGTVRFRTSDGRIIEVKEARPSLAPLRSQFNARVRLRQTRRIGEFSDGKVKITDKSGAVILNGLDYQGITPSTAS